MANGLSKFMNFLKLTDEDDEFDDDFYEDDYDYDDKKELEREERRLLKEQKKEESILLPTVVIHTMRGKSLLHQHRSGRRLFPTVLLHQEAK